MAVWLVPVGRFWRPGAAETLAPRSRSKWNSCVTINGFVVMSCKQRRRRQNLPRKAFTVPLGKRDLLCMIGIGTVTQRILLAIGLAFVPILAVAAPQTLRVVTYNIDADTGGADGAAARECDRSFAGGGRLQLHVGDRRRPATTLTAAS